MEENENVENLDVLEEVENGSEGIKIASDVIAVIAGVANFEVPEFERGEKRLDLI